MSKRDPSIHVKRSSLSEILKELVQGDPTPLVDEIFHRSSKHAIRNRVFLEMKARAKTKAAKVLSVDKQMAERFHAAYQNVNMTNNIKTSAIKQTDSKYATLKEVAQQASDFCKMFELSEDDGFKLYITMGIKLAKNQYSIYKLKGLSDSIINYYKTMETIQNDEKENATVTFYAAWKDVSIEYQGRSSTIEEPHLYVHFIYGRQAADKEGADYHDWIRAAFERWPNSSPELSHLYGDNAKLGYDKYMATKGKQYDTKDEQEYFEKGKIKAKTIKRKGRGD